MAIETTTVSKQEPGFTISRKYYRLHHLSKPNTNQVHVHNVYSSIPHYKWVNMKVIL